MEQVLKDRVAIVVGSSSGTGQVIACCGGASLV